MRIYGYGEDAFTCWALKSQLSQILNVLGDSTAPSDCLIFYRPSFGRGNKGGSSATFGEFDAILVTKENVYLIESKWDNFQQNTKDVIKLRKEQELRHKILSDYIINWMNFRKANPFTFNWSSFQRSLTSYFAKPIPNSGTLLAKNLKFILEEIYKQCKNFRGKPINVLLYFYDGSKSKKIKRVEPTKLCFKIVNIDYKERVTGGSFLPL